MDTFACCNLLSDVDCSYVIGDVREGFTAGECADLSAFLKKIPGFENQSLSYIAIFKQCLNLGGLFNQVTVWAVVIGGALAFVRLGIGAWQYAASTGDPTKLEEARGVIVFAVVGLLIIGLTYLMLKLGSELFPESWRVWFGVS
ncbi:hypothetical protein KJ596_00700 [Patescibacteria group bacterium]|nr:hypothetical protein [Patescibacteria group bacterium]MBU1867984.1 hypothetical protein [Patescibacteria group bacterium]